ncbi:hypothetical protein CDV55_102192 [Aspergillus turcosus]|uniref:Uncharacterized protein n=1 Tax=Aspergillus turcosus TaxID=1245748 RepID=A0A229X1M7_9EURO|nr:hypothetical protein CDV55_102192 [Aspergillus turcosus]RLL99130.1 hypothetical protein CFD26_106959 [Aspergillus turcosus]
MSTSLLGPIFSDAIPHGDSYGSVSTFSNRKLTATGRTSCFGIAYCVEAVGDISLHVNYTGAGAVEVSCLDASVPSSFFQDVSDLPSAPLMAGNITLPGYNRTTTPSQTIPTETPLPTASGTIAGCSQCLNYQTVNSTILDIGALVTPDQSNPEHDFATQYLETYFHLTPSSSEEDRTLVKSNLEQVSNFLQGHSTPDGGTPRLWCNDTWLTKMKRTDVAYDGDSSNELMTVNQDGSMSLVAIEDVKA